MRFFNAMPVKNTVIWITMLILSVSIFILFTNFDLLSYKIFLSRYRGDYSSSPYYELFLGIATFGIISLIFLFLKIRFYFYIWLIKGGIITLLLMIFYEANYGLDAYAYAGVAMGDHLPHPFGLNGTYNVEVINYLFTYIVGKSYYSLKVVNSLIGFLGLIFLYKAYEHIMFKNNLKIDYRFSYIFFLFPSVLFWSSILGKDPLNLFFVGMFTYAFIHIIDEFRFSYFLMIVLSVWLVSYIRNWYSVIMVTSMFLYYLKINSIRNFLILLIVLPVFTLLVQQFLQGEGITSFSDIFLKMTETTKSLSYGKSKVTTHVITGLGDYLLYYIPNLFTALFRPMIWDIRNPFTALAAVENVILLYLVYKYIFRYWRQIYSNKYLKFLILFIFSWSLLYVIISPANLGGAARFKLQVLPAMLILIGVAMAMSRERQREMNNKTLTTNKFPEAG